MKKKIYVEKEIDVIGDKFCGMCKYLDYKRCALFDKELEGLYPERCKECIEAERRANRDTKVVQVLSAWKYPCGKIYWTEHYLAGIYRTKKEARKKIFCDCGGGCKPEKVKIIVIKEEK